MNLVDRPGVEQAAQQAAAALDQHIGQPAAAQFGQQGIKARMGRFALAEEHFAAYMAKPQAVGLRGFHAGGHQHGRFAGSLTSWLSLPSDARVSRTTRTAVRGPAAERSAADRRARRSASDHDCIDTAAKSVDRLARLRIGNPSAFAGVSGDFAVERHGPFGDDPRPAGFHELEIRGVQPPCLGFQ